MGRLKNEEEHEGSRGKIVFEDFLGMLLDLSAID
jgi:hypothetical protein